jgi:predicted ATPase
MGQSLDHIRIQGFKSIRDQSVSLKPLNILIGANGAGKSNFVEVFRLLRSIVSERLQEFVSRKGGAPRLLFGGPKRTESLRLGVRFGPDGYGCTLSPTEDERLVFSDERLFLAPDADWRTENTREFFQGAGHFESAIVNVRVPEGFIRFQDYAVDALKSWQVYHFHDTSEHSPIKLASNVSDNRFLRPDGANIAAFLFYLKEKHERHYRRIVDVIGLVAPFFLDFDLAPDRRNETMIQLEWKERGFDDYRGPHQLSDGTLRFISLATLLMQPKLPATILLDEPELGLHPYAINILAELLVSAAERTQVIVATQSVPLLNHFSPEDILVVDRSDGESVFRRLDSENLEMWLEDYSLGELWEKNVLGGRPGR